MGMTWKSTCSIGWEYFIVCEDMGSSPMCDISVLVDLFLFLKLYMVVLGDNMIVNVCELAWNMNWLGGLALIWHS